MKKKIITAALGALALGASAEPVTLTCEGTHQLIVNGNEVEKDWGALQGGVSMIINDDGVSVNAADTEMYTGVYSFTSGPEDPIVKAKYERHVDDILLDRYLLVLNRLNGSFTLKSCGDDCSRTMALAQGTCRKADPLF